MLRRWMLALVVAVSSLWSVDSAQSESVSRVTVWLGSPEALDARISGESRSPGQHTGPPALRHAHPGDTVEWVAIAKVSRNNFGLAAISLDLDQSDENPVPITFPRAAVPDSMLAFDRPLGFSNPGDLLVDSGYGGTPTLSEAGRPRLVQIGGALNTFGAPGPCLGRDGEHCLGQLTEIPAGVGHGREGQVIARGNFVVPDEEGVYTIYVASGRALVLEASRGQSRRIPVSEAHVDLSSAHFHVLVGEQPTEDSDTSGVGSETAHRTKRHRHFTRPRDGEALHYTHVRFWWPPWDDSVFAQELQIVRDDGSPDPFADPSSEVLSLIVPTSEPRLTVTSGLEFGFDYAWRVRALTAAGLFTGESYRFSIVSLPDYLPGLQLFTSDEAELEPGLTLTDAIVEESGTEHPLFIALDQEGRIVYARVRSDLEGRGAVVSLDPSGRISYIAPQPGPSSQGQAVWEETLDGRFLWRSPDRDELRVHHDHGLISPGDPLLLVFEWYRLPEDDFEERRGDRIVVLDRHTGEEVWTWRAIDHYALGDGDTGNIANWTHGNAASYSEYDNSVYYSSRGLSRITKIDYETGDVLWHMGRAQPSGDTDFGDGLFTFQHAPARLQSGNILLFDNGNLSVPRESRAIEIALDDPDDPTEGEIIWQFEPVNEFGQPVFVGSQGDVDRLTNGNTLVTSGAQGLIHEVTEDGRVVWLLRMHQGRRDNRTTHAERIASLNVDAIADSDGDWDVDLIDLIALQIGASEEPRGTLGFPERLSDTNGDGVLDRHDLPRLVYWMTRPVD